MALVDIFRPKIHPKTAAALAQIESAEAGTYRLGLFDRLATTPLNRLEIPEEIQTQFQGHIAHEVQNLIFHWCQWIAVINLVGALFDVCEVTGYSLDLALQVRLLISLTFLFASRVVETAKTVLQRGAIVIVTCMVTIITANLTGLASQSVELFLIYYSMSLVVVYTAIMLLPIEMPYALTLAGLTVVQSTIFLFMAPLGSPAEKAQLLVFLGALMLALLSARRMMNLYHCRVFIGQLRDELRSRKMSGQNVKLSGIAYTDQLTGIPNRRYFRERIDALAEEEKQVLPCVMCLIDIDKFKNLNDKLGHLEGDNCLQAVATILRNELRGKTNLFARYGGEEFVLFLPKTELAEAVSVVNRLRMAVRDMNHPNPGTAIGFVTMSAGLSLATEIFEPNDMLQKADEALYRAKDAGRNQVCF
jgi:diguanylate cyclase (GGDEF)-like protein